MPLNAQDELFPEISTTGALMRTVNWAATALGPVEQWPQSLRTSVSICQNSAFAILIWWGRELVMLYNDAYMPIIGKKHPEAMGAPGRTVFPEIWSTIGPMLEGVMSQGKAVRGDDLLLFLERNGYSEECHFTFSYSPILGENGEVGGVFTPVHDTTDRVIGERRLRTISDLAEIRTEEARGAEQVCASAVESLAKNPVDLPFVAPYLFDEQGASAHRAAHAGKLSELLAPRLVAETGSWLPLRSLYAGEPHKQDTSFIPADELPHGYWGMPVVEIVALPITQPGSDRAKGFVVFGVNPRKRLDEAYRSFLQLVTDNISTAIVDAEIFEQERRRAESLAELDRAKTVFFSNVSHEFRTPLTLIMGPLEDLAADTSLSPDARERIALAHRNSLRLQKLANHLLEFSRIEAGRVEANFEPVDVAALTRDLASNFESVFHRAGLALELHIEPLQFDYYLDREMWEKVVLNLLSNAFKFTFQGGITVALSDAQGILKLTVRDTGTGIPASELPHIFQRFRRVEGAVGRSFEGSGIGLALVQELVRLHGGSITVESQEGKGSEFSVTIPAGFAHLPFEQVSSSSRRGSASPSRIDAFVAEAMRWTHGADSADNVAPEAEIYNDGAPLELPFGQRRRVLLADDNADMRRYLCRLLQDQFEVESVTNGGQALEAIYRNRPDLLISDVMMPVMDGLKLLEAIRADPRTASLPVILLSARAGEESQIEGLRAGADDYLVKPFSARELLARAVSVIRIAEVRAVTERRLRESEQELTFSLDATSQIPWTADPAGRILSFHRRWLEVTGLTHEEALASGWKRIQHPDDVDFILEAWDRSMRTGQPYDQEQRILTRNGEYRWMRVRALPRRDEFGNVVKWYGNTEDVDDRKRIELSLRDSERRMSVAQEAAGVLIWEWPTGTNVISWGPGTEKFYGRPPEELSFDAWAGTLHPDDLKRAAAIIQHSIQTMQPYIAEYRVTWPDGTERWLLARAELFRDDEDEPPRMIGANIDITLLKRAEQVLRESEARVREVLERTTNAVFVLDRDWRFVYLNPNAVTLITGGRDLIGKNVWEEFPNAIEREFYRQYHRVMDEGVSVQFEEYYPAPLDKWFEVHAYPTREGIAVFFHDVTTRRKSEAALRQNEKLAAAGRLAASISHEINNPLEAVINLLYLLQTDEQLSPQSREYLNLAQSELARVAHMANQTLRFYRQSTAPTQTSIAEVLDSVVTLYDRRLLTARIRVEKRYREMPAFLAYEGELRQVFANLIGNASDAVKPGGRIQLRIRPATDPASGREGVRITVADNGHGMSRETRQRLFEPFYSTKGITGTGLGLWVSRDLIRKHNGTVRIRSSQEPDHHGTVFSIFLPTDGLAPTIHPAPRPEEAVGAGS